MIKTFLFIPYHDIIVDMNRIKKRCISIVLVLIASLFISNPHASSNSLCNDGSISKSSGRGTCSWHGGIAGGSSSSRNNSGFGNSDPWGSTSRNSLFCSSIDRNKGRC